MTENEFIRAIATLTERSQGTNKNLDELHAKLDKLPSRSEFEELKKQVDSLRAEIFKAVIVILLGVAAVGYKAFFGGG